MKKQKEIKQEKPKFKTNYNGYKSVNDYEKVDPVSITVPNETFSLRDIVNKFSREYPKQLLREGYYDGENDDIDFDDVDLTRQPDFDYVDAFELKGEIQEKYKKKSKVAEEIFQVENKKQQAENQPSEV